MLFILNRPEHFFYKKREKVDALVYCTYTRIDGNIIDRIFLLLYDSKMNSYTTFLSLILCPFTTLHCTVQKVYIGFIRAFNIIKSDLKALIGSPRVLYLSILYTKSRKIVPFRSSLANESIPNF